MLVLPGNLSKHIQNIPYRGIRPGTFFPMQFPEYPLSLLSDSKGFIKLNNRIPLPSFFKGCGFK
jgi:hypothetical protein